jgi:hypothetical protein
MFVNTLIWIFTVKVQVMQEKKTIRVNQSINTIRDQFDQIQTHLTSHLNHYHKQEVVGLKTQNS